jgi:L-aminopeptidase/D-esterase-like protein
LPRPPRGTTLVAVVTNAAVDRRTLQRIAIAAHTGMAQAIVPVHTATDGDVVFASSTGTGARAFEERYPGEAGDTLGSVAAKLVVRAAVETAASRFP